MLPGLLEQLGDFARAELDRDQYPFVGLGLREMEDRSLDVGKRARREAFVSDGRRDRGLVDVAMVDQENGVPRAFATREEASHRWWVLGRSANEHAR